MAKVRVGINGFGRIGRNVAKCLRERYADTAEIVAINDLTDAATLAHLFTYDSFFGTYAGSVSSKEHALLLDGAEIAVYAEKDPLLIPWGKHEVDVVLECTGLFLTKEKAAAHISGGAKKVVMSAPSKDDTPMYIFGVNADQYHGETIISNASCTTNCLAPLVKILHEEYGIESGVMSTTHAFTQDQRLQDSPHKDLRRARSATLSIIPTSTGAATAVTRLIPELQGKLNGHSVRVPTQDVSIVDFVCQVRKMPASVEDVNALFRSAEHGELAGILQVSDLPLVSIDFRKNDHSAIVDSALTMICGGLVKVSAWYDNEWGYSMRLADMAMHVAKHV